jgi:hypothetical protein
MQFTLKIAMLDKSQDSSVGIATGHGLGFDSQQGQDFSFLHIIQISSGVRRAAYSMSTGSEVVGV